MVSSTLQYSALLNPGASMNWFNSHARGILMSSSSNLAANKHPYKNFLILCIMFDKLIITANKTP